MRIQVIFGDHRESDFTCKRCVGTGEEPGSIAIKCAMCLGAGAFQPGPCYMYEAPDPTPSVWSAVWVPSPRGPQRATVVSHGSPYLGEVKMIFGPAAAPPAPPATFRPGVASSLEAYHGSGTEHAEQGDPRYDYAPWEDRP